MCLQQITSPVEENTSLHLFSSEQRTHLSPFYTNPPKQDSRGRSFDSRWDIMLLFQQYPHFVRDVEQRQVPYYIFFFGNELTSLKPTFTNLSFFFLWACSCSISNKCSYNLHPSYCMSEKVKLLSKNVTFEDSRGDVNGEPHSFLAGFSCQIH